MQGYHWTRTLHALHEQAARRYGEGVRSAEALFDEAQKAQLAAIGARPIELYDYVEDAHSLDWMTAFLILSLRREYFLSVQKGVPSSRQYVRADFPAKDAELEGIRWLPRLILKAHCRLRGELPRDLMYGCGGDRAFFQKYDIHPADFLRFFWNVGEDQAAILAYVRGERPRVPLAAGGTPSPL